MEDLSFANNNYTASDIEVLEGLDPVRKRPGMYVGGTDSNALHHLVREVFDNCMDEVIAGHASKIEVKLLDSSTIEIRDNGRGIPVDKHPKFPNKSALEVILTSLHSGGKFNNKVYQTSGGLHGVGISVVNALSEYLEIEVARENQVWSQRYSEGKPQTELALVGSTRNRRGTKVVFTPDSKIFRSLKFNPQEIYNFIKSKAYLNKGVEVEWSCDIETGKVPQKEILKFENGLKDFMRDLVGGGLILEEFFAGDADISAVKGRAEWSLSWTAGNKFESKSFCNTIPTPLGGTHENGFKQGVLKSIKSYGEMIGQKRASQITLEDVFDGSVLLLSVFIPHPEFQGQTKEKLVNRGLSREVEAISKDFFDHWLSDNKPQSELLLSLVLDRVEERLSKKSAPNVSRRTIVSKLRLPGKLADCSKSTQENTEIFIVEGDSAGGSAKQARNRENQAVLPLRGKVLNVASSTASKINQNAELSDIRLALGCGEGSSYNEKDLRYEKVIIMTDADVDGDHIATLLMTYFYKMMPELIKNGHLYLAKPPLYKISTKEDSYYAMNDAEKDKLIESKGLKKFDLSRFKGLGEMRADQLRDTAMNPKKRSLYKVVVTEDLKEAAALQVSELMGKNPELRFNFIQSEALQKMDVIRDGLDV